MSLQIRYKNLVLDQESDFYLRNLKTNHLFARYMYGYFREKFHANHFWELKG